MPALQARTRTPVEAPATAFELNERVVVELEPAIYEELAGRYELPPEHELYMPPRGVVTLEYVEGRLWAEADFIPRVELLPESETQFFFRRGAGTRVTFVREDGRVVAFVIRGTRAEKID